MNGPAPRRWFLPLTPRQLTALVLEGDDAIAGPALPEAEARFADADAARTRFGLADPPPGAGRFLDHLLVPEDPGVHVEREGDLWRLEPTRTPTDAELWRLEADGRHRVISYYDTPAYGWRNARGPVRPAQDVGLRARWTSPETGERMDLVAAFERGVDGVHLVALTDPAQDPPAGFTWTKLGVSRRTVPVEDVELYEAGRAKNAS